MSRRISIFGASFASGPTFLLDDPSITAGLAAPFALFRLKTGYTGPVVDVRRTVGATTTIVSVGLGSGAQFTLDAPVTGVVTGSSAATNLGQFVNASGYSNPDSLPSAQDWFYSRGYNQNNGAQVWVQSSATSQPRGGTAGVMAMRNGRSEMVFDGSNDFCDFGVLGGATRPSNFSVISAAAIDGALTNNRTICGSADPTATTALIWGVIQNAAATPGRLWTSYGNGLPATAAFYHVAQTNDTPIVSGHQHFFEWYKQQGVIAGKTYVDGILRPQTSILGGTATDSGNSPNYQFSVGRYGQYADPGLNLLGGVQFIGVWTTNKESIRIAIKQKINQMLGTTW